MSAYHLDKRRVPARVVLATGATVAGELFLGDATPAGAGPERLADMLNAERGFFPVEVSDPSSGRRRVALFNRAHVVVVRLDEPELELDLDASYAIAPRRAVALVLMNGDILFGDLHVVAPEGRTRVSDLARAEERFRYLETPDGTCVVNFDHVIEIAPDPERAREGER
jgi:hypothetical protein